MTTSEVAAKAPPRANVDERAGGQAHLNVDGPLLASVIVPVFNHCDVTMRCLDALHQARTRCRFETIVVDDGSTDDSAARVGALDHVRLCRLDANSGFVAACNAGAAVALGRYLVFLNNDTQVADDWLDALVETLETVPDCGLVGAKLVYPDQTLQEAGGIVFRDGNACNYGRGEQADDPRFDYPREVDYCSGACIALPGTLFAAVGGFDPRYTPAYYEDTDLAFAVRRMGHTVWYQPRARVVHAEGATAGTDVTRGVKRFQALNREKFVHKWSDALASQPDVSEFIASAERCASHRRGARVLVVDAHFPYPDRDSGSLRMFGMLNMLVQLGCHVTFWAIEESSRDAHARALENRGVELVIAPTRLQALRWWRDHGTAFDLIILSRLPVALRCMRQARWYASQAPVIFDTVDLHFLRIGRGATLRGDADAKAQAEECRHVELGLVRKADTTLVVSEFERDLLSKAVPDATVRMFSNIHTVIGRGAPFDSRHGLLFLGNFEHAPNEDAARYLCEFIMPQVRAALPGCVLHIVGYAGKQTVYDLACEDVVVHGHVASLKPIMDSVRLALAPLRYGAGVKGKINLAMSHGVPVVTTSVGAEGMALVDHESAMIADEPAAFSLAVVEAYRDESLWQTLSDKGIDNIKRHFSEDTARSVLRDILAAEAGLQ